MPGASVGDGGTATLDDSGDKRALCPGMWNVQFLLQYRCRQEDGTGNDAHLIVEATPRRRMVSLCSMKGMILARGYSVVLVGSRKLVGRDWRKKVRPAGA